MMRVKILGLPDLSSLPPLLQVFLYTAFALSAVVIFFMTRMGLLKGKDTPLAGRAPQMLTFDDAALRDVTKAINSLALGMTRLGDLADRHMADLRQQREEDEIKDAERRGYERAQAEKVMRQTPNPKRTL